MSIGTLVGKQNPDGGWPYLRGGSWTEPTVYAVLALLQAGERDAVRRGLQWISRVQRSDGGWAPRPDVDESTWVTGLVALIPAGQLPAGTHDRAVHWLLGTMGNESTPIYRLREWLLGNTPPADQQFPGWPWVPGAAAWVGPTCIAILALEKEARLNSSAKARRRVEQGRRFLLARMCDGGGWNHGGVHALGYESHPYPETTGMALAALRGSQAPQLRPALQVARRFLAECRSADALNWLRLGLAAHGQLPPGYCPPSNVVCRTVSETSLDVLVSGMEEGRNTFLV